MPAPLIKRLKITSDTATGCARAVYRVTLFGAAVNVVLTLVKLAAGVFGRSTALVADAAHSLSDFVTDLVVVIFVRVAAKPSDECHAFGHGKFETLATVIIGLVLFAVGGGIFASGADKVRLVLQGEMLARPSFLALAAAAVSILTKELLYHYTRRVGDRCGSRAVVANAWHHRSDAFSSMGTFAGVGGAWLLGERWVILDPIAAVVVSLMIIRVAWTLTKPGLDELLEKSLPKEMEAEILALVTEDSAVTDAHGLRTRRVGPGIYAEIHVRLDGNMSVDESHEHTLRIEQRMQARFGESAHIIVHVEPKN